MHERGIPIDTDAFVVHKSEKYLDALWDIMKSNGFRPEVEIERGKKKNRVT